MKEIKPTAEEYLSSKGWDESNPIIGGILFKAIAQLIDEYAILKPYDPDEPRFPSKEEIDEMASLYPGYEIYVYAGIALVQSWMKNHGLVD
jgi:hypothetical protein